MIEHVSPAPRPSNRQPQERRRALLRHGMASSTVEVERPPTQRRDDEPGHHVTLSHLDEERQAKIAQLKRAVESGTYRVNAEQVAEKLLSEALVNTLA